MTLLSNVISFDSKIKYFCLHKRSIGFISYIVFILFVVLTFKFDLVLGAIIIFSFATT